MASQLLAPTHVMMNTQEAIKVVCVQKSEHEFALDVLKFNKKIKNKISPIFVLIIILFNLQIIMPQNFKFVFLLFDHNVEKLQVRPIDNRMLKVYMNSRQRAEEIGNFVTFNAPFIEIIIINFLKRSINTFIDLRILSTKTHRTFFIVSNKTAYWLVHTSRRNRVSIISNIFL